MLDKFREFEHISVKAQQESQDAILELRRTMLLQKSEQFEFSTYEEDQRHIDMPLGSHNTKSSQYGGDSSFLFSDTQNTAKRNRPQYDNIEYNEDQQEEEEKEEDP